MLVILYGPIAKMGEACRNYFLKERGFQYVEKLNYIDAPTTLTTTYGRRNLVSEQEFYDNTDSLFRYDVGGILVGFNQKQIDDAVYGDGNSLMTLSTGDIDFLGNIKQVYGDKVCLIYAYIDEATLAAIVEEGDYPPEEAATRLDIGRQVKEGYLRHRDIFDHVVIYGGKDSQFNMKALYDEFERILKRFDKKEERALCYGDVFVACAPADEGIEGRLCNRLTEKGVSVFDPRQLPQGEGYAMVAAEAIRHAKFVIPVLSERVDEKRMQTMASLLTLAADNGCLIVPLLVDTDYSDVADLLGDTADSAAAPYGMIRDADDETIPCMAHDLRELIAYEEKVSACARKAEDYRRHKIWETALYWQKQHYHLCCDIRYSDVNQLKETYIGGREVAAESAVKTARILLEKGSPAAAVEWLHYAIDFDSGFDALDTTAVLIEAILQCYARMDVDGEEAYALLSDLFFADYTEEVKTACTWVEEWLEEWMIRYGELLDEQDAATVSMTTTLPAAEEQERIAHHGESALNLFEDMLKGGGDTLARADLVEGYQRILNYCTHMGVRGAVLDQCIDRLNTLKAQSGAAAGSLTHENRALKMYLGERLADDGEYDVFLSFKSEDTAMATTVYEFLTRNGKKVFFSKETLPMLGESEYEEAIFNAIEHARHMIVVSSDSKYVKAPWVQEEWSTFTREVREGRKTGELLLVLTDAVAADKGQLPTQLRKYEIVKMSEFRQRLLAYLH